MMYVAVLLLFAMAEAGPIDNQHQSSPQSTTDILSESNNDFTIKLFKQILKPGENMVASPFSASIALAMLLGGAKGTTASEINNLLGYQNLSGPQLEEAFKTTLASLKSGQGDYILNIANSIWVRRNLEVIASFKETLANVFDAEQGQFSPVNGHVAINQWVDQKTNHKIPTLLKELPREAALLLLNAIYFKGAWAVGFNQSNNYDGYFKTNDISQQLTTFMHVKSRFRYGESNSLKAQILQLPYKGEDTSLIVILPVAGSRLTDVENRLTSSNLLREIDNLWSKEVMVTLPKFKIETSLKLKSPLQNLGMKRAFTNSADLSGIHVNGELEVSDVVQKALIEVNEEGSEAAAATAVIVNTRLAHAFLEDPVQFKATHPFLFVLHHEPTNTILFMGRYTKVE